MTTCLLFFSEKRLLMGAKMTVKIRLTTNTDSGCEGREDDFRTNNKSELNAFKSHSMQNTKRVSNLFLKLKTELYSIQNSYFPSRVCSRYSVTCEIKLGVLMNNFVLDAEVWT